MIISNAALAEACAADDKIAVADMLAQEIFDDLCGAGCNVFGAVVQCELFFRRHRELPCWVLARIISAKRAEGV